MNSEINEIKILKEENQELLKKCEIHLEKINEALSHFVLDKEKTVRLEELRNNLISYILEINQCIQVHNHH